MAKTPFDFKEQGEKLEVIPAVERVKKDYLDARQLMIQAFYKVSYRRKYNLAYSKELCVLEAAVISMYLQIRDKFDDADDIRKLDAAILSNRRTTLEELFTYGKILLKKLEDLKLTKIEFSRGDPTRSIY